jgi:hypothetical protein
VLLDGRTRQRGLINPAAVETLLDEHRAGQRAGGDAIWALMNLELWYRTFIDGDGIQTLPETSRLSTARTSSSYARADSSPSVGAGFSRPSTDDTQQPTAAA